MKLQYNNAGLVAFQIIKISIKYLNGFFYKQTVREREFNLNQLNYYLTKIINEIEKNSFSI